MTMKKYIATGFLTLGILVSIGFATPTFAQTTDVAAQIQALLAQIKALQAQIAQLQGSTGVLSCSTFADLSYGNFDTEPGGRVSQLQAWLGIPSNTFGFGTYGPKTRNLWNSKCGNTASVIPSVTTPTPTNPTPTPNPIQTTIPSPSVYLYANPTSIVSDGKPGTITLYWSSTNATYCNFEKSKLSPSGSMAVSLSQTTTYTVSCTGAGGTNSSNPVTVPFQLTQQLPSADLKINNSDGPITKSAGYSNFSWTSNNSDYCTASGDTYWSGAKSTSGSENVWTGNEKTGVTTYQLTCGASSGKVDSSSDSVTVNFSY